MVAAEGPERREAADRLDEARLQEADAQSALVQASAAERDAAAAAVEQAATVPATSQGDGSAPAALSAPRSSASRGSTSGSRPVVAVANPGSIASSAAGLGVGPAGGGASAEESAFLARVRACESHGIYTIVSSTGRYRGAYQFSVETWRGVGGSGDPAAASPAEQDARALALLRLQGRRAWPVCGR
ncbi:MAG: transglycosylase family protein [Actinobacteria bacterium]|nr:transglycosylase family protein [Actinomycetota bacterium]